MSSHIRSIRSSRAGVDSGWSAVFDMRPVGGLVLFVQHAVRVAENFVARALRKLAGAVFFGRPSLGVLSVRAVLVRVLPLLRERKLARGERFTRLGGQNRHRYTSRVSRL